MKRIQSVPLVIGQFLEAIDQHTGIVGSTTGEEYITVVCTRIVDIILTLPASPLPSLPPSPHSQQTQFLKKSATF